MRKIKVTTILLFSSLIVSCGFHLRGNQDLSAVLPEVKIQGTNIHSELGRVLTRTLSNAKVSLLDESDVQLTITEDKFSKRVLSLDSAGRANQYELSYRLGFSLLKSIQEQGKNKTVDLIPAQTILERREYLFDANLVLAKADEEARLNSDMRKAAMLQLVRRLKFLLKSQNNISH